MYSESDFTLPFEQILDCGPASMAPEAPMTDSLGAPLTPEKQSEKHPDWASILQCILQKLEHLEKDVGQSTRLEKRFDTVDRELSNNSRLEGIEKDIGKLRDSINSLANDLRSFSVEVNMRLKEANYPAE
ncbi:hypothetical protein E5D57_003330 [Metarhizium anisopliae]|nr:hypothetical protein E5D57_003330 [Metarhizium anisopliae]